MLQRIRIHDFWNTYSEYLDVGEDPADKDPQLQESLRRNKEASSKKIAEVSSNKKIMEIYKKMSSAVLNCNEKLK